jgi:hypothetical protein
MKSVVSITQPAKSREMSRIIILRARKMIILGKKGEREVTDYHFAGAGKVIVGGSGTKKDKNSNE